MREGRIQYPSFVLAKKLSKGGIGGSTEIRSLATQFYKNTFETAGLWTAKNYRRSVSCTRTVVGEKMERLHSILMDTSVIVAIKCNGTFLCECAECNPMWGNWEH